MEKIAIFGCGTAGRRALPELRLQYKVVNFLDNDARIHGSKVAGVRVSNPENYDYDAVERVFIASMYLDEILVQLLGLGVPSSKIQYVKQESLGRAASRRWRGLDAVQRALYVPFRLLR
jgi:FlaA1/EpsC-like NDP-sugar epimerase